MHQDNLENEEAKTGDTGKSSVKICERNNPNNQNCFCGESFLAEQKEEIRKNVCKNLPIKYEYNGNCYCVLHYPQKTKVKEFWDAIENKRNENDFDFCGVWFPDLVDFSSKGWKSFFENISPDSTTTINFSESVFISDLYLKDLNFNTLVNFESTKFFGDADFSHTKFMKSSFAWATFKSTVAFDNTTFCSVADFWAVKFDQNSNTYFRGTNFEKHADFRYVILKGYIHFTNIKFSGQQKGFDFQYIHHDNPERTTFRNLDLEPNWFVDADAHKITFEDINWKKSTSENELEKFKSCINREIQRVEKFLKQKQEENKQSKDIEEIEKTSKEIEYYQKEISRLKMRRDESSYQLLSIALRQIAATYEEKGFYEEASRFRKLAFNTEWIDKKRSSRIWWQNLSKVLREDIYCSNTLLNLVKQKGKLFRHLRQYHPHVLYRLYRWSSSYGESWAWASFILIGMIIVFAILYVTPICSFSVEQSENNSNENLIRIVTSSQNLPKNITEVKIIKDANSGGKTESLSVINAITHSLKVGTLQSSKLEPKNSITVLIVTLETIIVPIQLALLALAIRRKFMR